MNWTKLCKAFILGVGVTTTFCFLLYGLGWAMSSLGLTAFGKLLVICFIAVTAVATGILYETMNDD